MKMLRGLATEELCAAVVTLYQAGKYIYKVVCSLPRLHQFPPDSRPDHSQLFDKVLVLYKVQQTYFGPT